MKKISGYALAVFLCVLLIINPERSVYYAAEGLSLCTEVIIPSLFPTAVVLAGAHFTIFFSRNPSTVEEVNVVPPANFAALPVVFKSKLVHAVKVPPFKYIGVLESPAFVPFKVLIVILIVFLITLVLM